jgi:hypothetical protein
MSNDSEIEAIGKTLLRATSDRRQVASRMNLAAYTASVFRMVGRKLHVVGRAEGVNPTPPRSPFGQGDDATVAVSMLLRIGSQLVSASTDLFRDGRTYAASALVRQLVEVEYLAWAFETNNEDSTRWLRSTHEQRRAIFTPAKLRAAAGGRFRSLDYNYHCEMGGHPTPGPWLLLNDDATIAQLMLSDCLGHSGRIWDHVVRWAKSQSNGVIILARNEGMLKRYSDWKRIDELTSLPPPGPFPAGW